MLGGAFSIGSLLYNSKQAKSAPNMKDSMKLPFYNAPIFN